MELKFNANGSLVGPARSRIGFGTLYTVSKSSCCLADPELNGEDWIDDLIDNFAVGLHISDQQ